MKAKRVEIYIAPKLLEKVEKYKEENGFMSRSTAIADLIRKGLQK